MTHPCFFKRQKLIYCFCSVAGQKNKLQQYSFKPIFNSLYCRNFSLHNVRYTQGLLKKTLFRVQIKDFFDISSRNISHLVTAIQLKKKLLKNSVLYPIYKLCDRGMIQNLSHNQLNFKMLQFSQHGEKLSEVLLLLIQVVFQSSINQHYKIQRNICFGGSNRPNN